MTHDQAGRESTRGLPRPEAARWSALKCRPDFFAEDAQRLVDLAAGLQDVGYPAHGDGHLAHVAQANIDRKLLFRADAQRLVELATGLQDVGDLAHGDGLGAHVAQALVDGKLFFLADAQRLVELAAGLQDVGDLAHSECPGAHVAQALVDRKLFFLADAQCLVELAAGLQDIGNPAHGDGLGAHIAQALVDGKLLFLADAQRLVELAAGLQDVGDLAMRDRLGPFVAEPPIQGQFGLTPVLKRLVVVAQVVQQSAEFVERRHQQFVGRIVFAREPTADLCNATAAFCHRSVIDAIRPGRQGPGAGVNRDGIIGRGVERVEWGCTKKCIDTAAPGPQIRGTPRRQRNGIGIEPEDQPRARLRRQAFAAYVEGVPALLVEPPRPADDVDHRARAGVLDETVFEHGHVGDPVAQGQAARAHACRAKHIVERCHHLLAQVLVGGIDQKPLERRAMHQRAR